MLTMKKRSSLTARVKKKCCKQVSFHNTEKVELSHGTKFLYATER